ncbi:protein AAR2-like protein [Iris pallida]|uniref:Protein AAR2-like protein n=1 Tax=Iris pallida TaxID=29817 RepID=A0AAX6EBI8_IRIPA|nr:protein AAR2-like protein [Iris pallida]
MASSSVGMDQETALELVKKGSTLLLLDVPQFTLLGIDTQVFSVGPIFKGIKMIPPGPHFVYYNPSNKEGNEFSPTTGFFIVTHPSEVIVRKWHQQEERLVRISEEEETRYSEAVQRFEFDRQLGPYALEQFAEWRQLSGYITKETIERIEPIGGEITIVYESGMIEKNPRTAIDKQLVEQLRDSKFSKCAAEKVEKKGCYYKDIPHVIKQDITGGELTSLNLDKTSLLETILMEDYEGAEDLLLGELQFAFVAFMLGQSLEGFLQWKALVSLLFSCTEAPLRTRSQLFTKFIRVVYFQLKHGFDKQNKGNSVGKGISLFLDDTMFSKDIFLFRLCKEFFPLVLESHGVDGDLLLWTRKLKSLLETAFGWEFKDNADVMCEDEDDEFSPVIVPPNEAIPSEDRAS